MQGGIGMGPHEFYKKSTLAKYVDTLGGLVEVSYVTALCDLRKRLSRPAISGCFLLALPATPLFEGG